MKWEWNRFTSIKVSVADITVCRRAVRSQNDTRHDTFINKINRGNLTPGPAAGNQSLQAQFSKFFFSTTKPETSSEWGHHQSNPCWDHGATSLRANNKTLDVTVPNLIAQSHKLMFTIICPFYDHVIQLCFQ